MYESVIWGYLGDLYHYSTINKWVMIFLFNAHVL